MIYVLTSGGVFMFHWSFFDSVSIPEVLWPDDLVPGPWGVDSEPVERVSGKGPGAPNPITKTYVFIAAQTSATLIAS